MVSKCNYFWILDNSNINNRYNEAWIARDLLEGTLRTIYDGSYKPKLNDKGITTTWIIEDDKSRNNILGTVATSGITSDTYKCELLGTYAILSVISYVEKYNHHLTVGNIKVECNNEETG